MIVEKNEQQLSYEITWQQQTKQRHEISWFMWIVEYVVLPCSSIEYIHSWFPCEILLNPMYKQKKLSI